MTWTVQLSEVDFEQKTATFVIPDNFRACAGDYVMMLDTDFEQLNKGE